MPAAVVYDPDGVLPSSFASDTGLRDAVVRVESASDACRLGRDALVLVLVAGRDNSGAYGLLALFRGRRMPRLVLFTSEARHHRRLLIRAGRHDAIVLVAQSPATLTECVRGLLLHPPVVGAAHRNAGRSGTGSVPIAPPIP